MAVREIAYEDVAAAAEGLVAQGRAVSLVALRASLAEASAVSLAAHLATWRAQRQAPLQGLDLALPEPVASALSDWARQLAEQSGAGPRASLAQADEELGSLLAAHDELGAERDALSEQLAERSAALEQTAEQLALREAEIERLRSELRHARDIASEALVGKAKDQLAIEGKDAQLADLRQQLERNLASSAAESDARLKAEMELVGAVTARNNLVSEVADLRAQLDAALARRSA